MNILPATIGQRISVVDGDHWLWTGLLNEHGYGSVRYQRKLWLAHRLVWSLLRGTPPPALHHECKVRNCVNPAHLHPSSSHAEHMRDHHNPELTHCHKGHSLDDAYVVKRRSGKTERRCRTCALTSQRIRQGYRGPVDSDEGKKGSG